MRNSLNAKPGRRRDCPSNTVGVYLHKHVGVLHQAYSIVNGAC